MAVTVTLAPIVMPSSKTMRNMTEMIHTYLVIVIEIDLVGIIYLQNIHNTLIG